MTMNNFSAGRRATGDAWVLAACGLVFGLTMTGMRAGAQSSDEKVTTAKVDGGVNQTIFLKNAAQQNDLTDIQTDLRNLFPRVKIYGIPAQHAISIHGSPEDIAEAERIVTELDKPRPSYRLTFTLAGANGGQSGLEQSFTLIAGAGEKTVFKQGTRVPIVTGHYDAEATTSNSQLQYMDVGLTIEVTAVRLADGVGLRSKVEQSSLSEEKSGVGVQDPVVSQAVWEGSSTVTPGTTLVLGSISNPGTGHKQEISVAVEQVK